MSVLGEIRGDSDALFVYGEGNVGGNEVTADGVSVLLKSAKTLQYLGISKVGVI